jgi:hypothetical protein
MAKEKKVHQKSKFIVRQAGLSYDDTTNSDENERGCLQGFNEESAAVENRDERNNRAAELGIKARYEVVAGSDFL